MGQALIARINRVETEHKADIGVFGGSGFYKFLDDDKEVGIKSTGILFETNPKRYLAIFIFIIILIAGPTFYFLSNGDRFQIFVLTTGVFFFCLHLTFQLLNLAYRNPKNCLATFKSNRTAGLILTGFMIVATLTKL